MTQNLDLHIFTPDQLHEHDLNIATKVHQATKELLWSTEKLEQVLRHIEES